MNETLYNWTFKFRKVVRQQNSGAVEYLKLFKSVHICQSYRKNKSDTFLWPTVYIKKQAKTKHKSNKQTN